MTFIEVKEMIASMELSFNYYQWPESQAPALPYILFYYPERDDFIADGKNYQHITKLNIEFYSKDKDFETESVIESVLEENEIVYTKEEQYIASERMYEVLYTMEVLING